MILGTIALAAGCNSAEHGDLPYLLPTPTGIEAGAPTTAPDQTENTEPTPEPTKEAEPTKEPTPEVTPEATPTPKPEKTKEDFVAADFFEDTVFAGDSVLSHFYWKVPFYDKENFGGSDFLVAVSYSVREALKPVSETSIHPMYKGEQRQIWDSMELLNPKRVFCSSDSTISVSMAWTVSWKTTKR